MRICCTCVMFLMSSMSLLGSEWSTPIDIFTTPTTHNLVVGMNARGDTILAWKNSSAQDVSSVSSSDAYSTPPMLYSPPSGVNVISAVAALDQSGCAIALWITLDSLTNQYQILTNRLNNNAWGKELCLDCISDGSSFARPNLCLDGHGNAYAVWEKDGGDGYGTIYCSQYLAATDEWKQPVLLSPMGISAQPQLAVNAFGGATVVWCIGDSGKQTVQAVYAANQAPSPPKSFSGKQVEKTYDSKTDLVNILYWTSSPDPKVTCYYIFRDSKQIATVSSKGPLNFEDRRRKAKKKHTYEITAVSGDKTQSTPLTLTLP